MNNPNYRRLSGGGRKLKKMTDLRSGEPASRSVLPCRHKAKERAPVRSRTQGPTLFDKSRNDANEARLAAREI
jgi:hypothetical protein